MSVIAFDASTAGAGPILYVVPVHVRINPHFFDTAVPLAFMAFT